MPCSSRGRRSEVASRGCQPGEGRGEGRDGCGRTAVPREEQAAQSLPASSLVILGVTPAAGCWEPHLKAQPGTARAASCGWEGKGTTTAPSSPLQPEGAREAHGGHSHHLCASRTDFKCWRYPGIQRPGSSKHTVDKGREDKRERRELSLGHCSHPGKLGFISPSPAQNPSSML